MVRPHEHLSWLSLGLVGLVRALERCYSEILNMSFTYIGYLTLPA